MHNSWPETVPEGVFGQPVEYNEHLSSMDKVILFNPRELGAGKYGAVYPAEFPSSKSIVAKVIFHSPRYNYRFTVCREVMTCFKLRHPNIVRCLGAMQTTRWPVVFYERVRGQTLLALNEHLDSCGGYHTERNLAYLASKVLGALHYLQSGGIVHCDLHEGNIMVSADGNVKVIDFGMAKDITGGKVTDACPRDSAHPREMVSTKYGGIDHKVDIFFLGRTLYRSIIRQVPFKVFLTQTEKEQCKVLKAGVNNIPIRYWVISQEMRDFMNDLMSYKACNRPDAFIAVLHPWITMQPGHHSPALISYEDHHVNPTNVRELNEPVLQAMVDELGNISLLNLSLTIIEKRNSWQAIAYRANLLRHTSATAPAPLPFPTPFPAPAPIAAPSAAPSAAPNAAPNAAPSAAPSAAPLGTWV
ncbi:sperm motility kinase 3A-like [Sycon ciliatum]|uniref:sperm motility kinase 3A-like n=1 Tax=Sycon ciliatum TaxID=27933 RepID=UPI0031F71BE5